MNANFAAVRDMARELARYLDNCRDYSHGLAGSAAICRACGDVAALSRDLDAGRYYFGLDRAAALSNVLGTALLEISDVPRDRNPRLTVVRADIEAAYCVARDIFRVHMRALEDYEADRHGIQPDQMALSLVRHAARVVPIGHRCRYDEEFLADLTEVARHRGRWAQLGYASRVLVRGLSLRWALRGVAAERVES